MRLKMRLPCSNEVENEVNEVQNEVTLFKQGRKRGKRGKHG